MESSKFRTIMFRSGMEARFVGNAPTSSPTWLRIVSVCFETNRFLLDTECIGDVWFFCSDVSEVRDAVMPEVVCD